MQSKPHEELRPFELGTKRFVISFTHNCFVWVPMKSGSHTLSWVLPYYDFDIVVHDGKNYINDNFRFHFGHDTNFPPNHESFTFICSIRRPYEAFFSFFKMNHRHIPEKLTKENFDFFFSQQLEKELSSFSLTHNIFSGRTPDFVIRAENMYSDLIQIPFIRDSKLNDCGILEEMCQRKLNRTVDIKCENFYDRNQIDLLNERFSKYFEVGNYDKW